MELEKKLKKIKKQLDGPTVFTIGIRKNKIDILQIECMGTPDKTKKKVVNYIG